MREEQIIWVNQLKKGEQMAAYNLYHAYSDAMFNTLTRLLNDREQAEDLLQEAFVKAFREVGKLAEPKAFGGWLKRIVVNTGLEYIRRKKYDFEAIDNMEVVEEETVNEALIDNETLHKKIKGLPDGCRAVLCLHLLEGFKHKEIASQLGISESTSKTQYRHAKAILRKELIHYYEN